MTIQSIWNNDNTTTTGSLLLMSQQKTIAISPEYEPARLKTLRDYCVLDTEQESRFDELTLLASRICNTPIALISLIDEDRLFFKSAIGLKVKEISSKHSFCLEVVKQCAPVVVKDAKEDERFASNPLVHDNPYFRFYAAAPLKAPNGHVIGTLCVIDYIPRDISLEQQEALNILSRQVITQLELDIQAIRDPLTELFNRRYADEMLRSELKRMERKNTSLGLIIVDIDHFKNINDTHGHGAGDAVLKSFGKHLMENVRFEDVACRIGGEEFMVIMPETTLDVAQQRSEQIREQFHDMKFIYDNIIIKNISLSIGVATYPAHGKSAEEIFSCADRALYQAKTAGRNQVITA